MRERVAINDQQRSLLRRLFRLLGSLLASGGLSPAFDPSIGIPPRFRCVPQHDPGRRVIAGTFGASDVTIHARIFQALGALRAQEQNVDA